jgi:hypothetical protein
MLIQLNSICEASTTTPEQIRLQDDEISISETADRFRFQLDDVTRDHWAVID